MDSKLLMVGDWVHSSFFGRTRIKAIRELNGYGWVLTTADENWKSDASLSPIPLTAEILEKIGFKDGGVLSYEFYDGYHVFLEAEKRSVHAGALWYVHELQHALRLCGLNGLADSIII